MADHVGIFPLTSITVEQELRALEEKVEQLSVFDFSHSAENDFSSDTNTEVDKMTRPDIVNLDDEGDETEEVVSSGFPNFDWDELEGKLRDNDIQIFHNGLNVVY